MSDHFQDEHEPADLSCQGGTGPWQDTDDVMLSLSLKWSEFDQQKRKIDLERSLQTWFNKSGSKVDCSVESVSTDGSAVIRVKPAPGLSDLQKLNRLTLRTNTLTVTIRSVGLMPSEHTLPDPREKEPEENCSVPVFHFWYVSQIYKEEMKQIERKNGVKTTAHVKVSFEVDGEDGSPQTALSEFTNLVQKSLADARGSVIPLKFVDPDQWSDAMKVIQKSQNKLLLLLSSEEVTVGGPSHSQEVFSATLNAMQRTTTSFKNTHDAHLKTSVDVNDLHADLAVEESCSSSDTPVTAVKASHNVVSNISKGKVSVNTSNKTLYKSLFIRFAEEKRKAAKMSQIPKQPYNGPGCSDSLKIPSSAHHPESSSEPVLNTHSTAQMRKTHPAGGATAGVSTDEKCPVCLDSFKEKKQLKCKHEFCEECLETAKKCLGPICPVCKDVFGVMEGDQPPGTMTCSRNPSSLPGFSDCGHIVITYDIPRGIQTEKHPNPGQHHAGTCRTAYLPDNKEGNEVLQLLKRAFHHKLIFTVGTSRTTGLENQVTWTDISHKTFMSGGPQSFGYPDPGYIGRVKNDLKAKGLE